MKDKINTKEKEKFIFITGAGGFLAGELIEQLLQNTSYSIYVLTTDKQKILTKYSNIKRMKCFDMVDFVNQDIPWNKIETIIHCAFARGYRSDREIAESLSFTHELFNQAATHGVSSLINISSQGVYGQENKPIWYESTSVAPNSNYSVAKYASELFSYSARIISDNSMNISNIRLASLSGGREGIVPEVISKFVLQVLRSENIKIVGGKQILSYLDVRDAASGIIALLSVDPQKWKNVYNLGNNEYVTLKEIANIVLDISKSYTNSSTQIEIIEKDIQISVGMDASLFYKDTNWRPIFDTTAIVDSLFKYYTN